MPSDDSRRPIRKSEHESCLIKTDETARTPLNSRTSAAALCPIEYTIRVIFNVP